MLDPADQVQRSAKVFGLVIVGITLFSLIGGLTAFIPLLFVGGGDDGAVMTSAPLSQSSPPGTLVAPAQPTLPATCGLNDEMTIDGAVGRYQQTVIHVGQNCTLTIRNSNLQGPVVIQGSLNARIRIENSTIQGDTVGIAPGQNGHVVLVGNSVVTGNSAAVRLGTNGQLMMIGGRIYSPNTAVEGGTNAEVTATDAQIQADATALRGSLNFEARLPRTELVGAVTPGQNGDVQQM